MIRRPGLGFPFALAVLLALPAAALAQDPKPPEGGTPAGQPVPAPVPAPGADKGAAGGKAEDAPPDVKGSRYRIKLKRGTTLEGILPYGVMYEKRDPKGDYMEATETEKGAGLRLLYVLGLEGDIFILKSDIDQVKDLGAMTEEQRLAIQQQILEDRRKKLEAREKTMREEMERMAAQEREAQRVADAKTPVDKKDPKEVAKALADQKKGDELLRKFQPPEWGKKKIEDIERREIVSGIFRSDAEKEFIDGFKLWQAALDRKLKAEAEAGGEGGSGTGSGGDAGGSGDSGGSKEPPPPADGGKDKDKGKKKKGGQ